MGLKDRLLVIREGLADKAGEAFASTVRFTVNDPAAASAAARVRSKYDGLPADALAGVLIKRARRLTKWEGAANGLAVTGVEVVVAAPVPEPGHKVAAGAGIGALLLADIAWVTKVQTQLILEIGHVYNVPFDKDDEEDLYTVFKAAMGLKGTERTATYGRFVATETARKQFRAYLRTGVRRELQRRVTRLAGEKVGRYLAEKYVMRVIPVANAAIGYTFNDFVTKRVGFWAKVKSKVRAGSVKHVTRLREAEPAAAVWALPVLYWVGTAHKDDLSDNFLAHYALTQKRLDLDEPTARRVEELVDDDDLAEQFAEGLPGLGEGARRVLYGLAVLTAAVDLKPMAAHEEAVAQVARWLAIDHPAEAVRNQVRDLQR